MDACHALDLPHGRKALVKAFVAEHPLLLAPRCKPFTPALHAVLFPVLVSAGKIGADADHGLDCHWFGDHITIAAPRVAPDLSGCFQKVAHDCVIPLCRATVRPFTLDRAPRLLHPTMNFVIKLSLQNPFLLFASAAEAID